MAISTKVITMRQGNKADYQASKMLAGELAVINDAEELHFSPKSGKSIRVATENDLKELENKIPSGGGTPFSGLAKDVTYDDSKTQLGAENVQDAIGKVSEQIDALGGGTGLNSTAKNLLITILRSGIYSTDQSANITALETALSSGADVPDTPVEPEQPEIGIVQTGSVLTLSNVTDITSITQTGTTLILA